MRGISLISAGRQPIITKVGPWDPGAVAAAISEELARGGQAYYVHNRVRSMEDCVKTLQELLPQARFAVVHGQMKGPEIEAAMWDFFNRKSDVLVASTIIESGLDIPTVNTLLVEDAHEFGLAQLYQLRGRIGRERQRAYCYLFFPESHGEFSALSEEARKRLEALREFGMLGSGVKLAMRDLEIRGAGDLLGARQHGFINAVGVEFYTELLNDEIARRRAVAAPKASAPAAQLDLKLPAFIPADYLPGELERLEFYKKILRADAAEAAELRKQLEGLSGPLPEPVKNLFELLELRARAGCVGLRSATQKAGGMEVYFRPGIVVDPGAPARWQKAYAGRMRFIPSGEGDGLSVELSGQTPGVASGLPERVPGLIRYQAMKLLVLAAAALALGCRPSSETVVAKVGAMKITQSEFRRKLGEVAQNYQNYVLTPNGRRQFLDVLIREKMVLAAAQASEVPRSAEFRAQLERLRAEEEERAKESREYLLTKLWLDDLRQRGALKLSEDEVRGHHRKYPIEVDLRHILVAAPGEAEALAKKVRGGANFAQLAKSNSLDAATAADGGRMQPAIYGEIIPDLEDVAFACATARSAARSEQVRLSRSEKRGKKAFLRGVAGAGRPAAGETEARPLSSVDPREVPRGGRR